MVGWHITPLGTAIVAPNVALVFYDMYRRLIIMTSHTIQRHIDFMHILEFINLSENF